MYTKAIVTFIDILGFRDLVSKASFEEIKQKIDLITYFATPLADNDDDEGEETFNPTIIQFSDSIIRVRPIDSGFNKKYQIGILFHELLDLVQAQGDLINKGILLRGGIAMGDVYISGNTIFGPAFISAYDIESKLANFPRIVISPDLIKEAKTNNLLKANHHDLEQELKYIGNLTTKGDDGIWFVDYCRAVQEEVNEPEDYVEFLKNHKSLIIENATAFKGLTSVSAKYMWLANYHNTCVASKIKPEFIESNNLLISESELELLHSI